MRGHKHITFKDGGAVFSRPGWTDPAPKGKTVQGIIRPVLAGDDGRFDLSPFQLPVNPVNLPDARIVADDGTTLLATIQSPRILLTTTAKAGIPVCEFIYNATNVPNNWQAYIYTEPGTPTYVPEGPEIFVRYVTTGGIVFDSHYLGQMNLGCQSVNADTSWFEDISYFDRIESLFIEWSGSSWVSC
jgi:hypothetical protein